MLEKIAQYSQLQKISEDAWKIVVTTLQGSVTDTNEDVETKDVTTVTGSFTERLLRDILDLDAGQQLSLCQDLAKGEKNGGMESSASLAIRHAE